MRFASNFTTLGNITVRIFYGPVCSTQLNFLVLVTQEKVMGNIPHSKPVQSDISIGSFRSSHPKVLRADEATTNLGDATAYSKISFISQVVILLFPLPTTKISAVWELHPVTLAP